MDPGLIGDALNGCNAAIESIESEQRLYIWLSLGSSIATAMGAAAAAFVDQARVKKIGALVALVTAVLTTALNVLPPNEKLDSRRLAADRHRSEGRKISTQIGLLSDPEAKVEYTKHAVARFSDCQAAEPGVVPPMPLLTSDPAAAAAPPVREAIAQLVAGEEPRKYLQLATLTSEDGACAQLARLNVPDAFVMSTARGAIFVVVVGPLPKPALDARLEEWNDAHTDHPATVTIGGTYKERVDCPRR